MFMIFLSLNVQLHCDKVNNLSIHIPPFKVFLSLVFKSTASQRNCNEGFTVLWNMLQITRCSFEISIVAEEFEEVCKYTRLPK
jgi:hypothetical protein